MLDPISTYRIQFNKDFTFNDLDSILPYLQELGVKTIYAAPIFKSVPGSNHGYDGLTPLQLNPEIGTEKQLLAIAKKIKKMGMYWLQDIVPNHLSFHPDNEWLMDVLKNGDKSGYKNFFDIGFPTAMDDERLMVPFLGETLEEAIEERKVQLVQKKNQLFLAYADQFWPAMSKPGNF